MQDMRISRWIGLLGIATVVGIGEQAVLPLNQIAIAQVAEIPQPDRNGNFNTAILGGNVGNYYPNNQWVVMPQPDAGGLNCRESPNGKIKSVIVPGAIIQAIFNDPIQPDGRGGPLHPDADAIDLSIGRPWLHVTGSGHLFFPVPSENGDRSEREDCYVRANIRYIAPINEEAN